MSRDELLLAHSYILVETTALAQRRLGLDAVRALRDDLFPMLTVEWVDAALHAQAFAALIAARLRSVSLVDHVSFELMRRRGVRRALTVDSSLRRPRIRRGSGALRPMNRPAGG